MAHTHDDHAHGHDDHAHHGPDKGIMRWKMVAGAVNAAAPQPVTFKSFNQIMGQYTRGHAGKTVPTFVLKAILGEQATMFFLDPSGNAIEIKAMRDPAKLFATE